MPLTAVRSPIAELSYEDARSLRSVSSGHSGSVYPLPASVGGVTASTAGVAASPPGAASASNEASGSKGPAPFETGEPQPARAAARSAWRRCFIRVLDSRGPDAALV
ncbi:MAG: hypothetical protein R3A48_05085 [Polyangiales bacterium]